MQARVPREWTMRTRTQSSSVSELGYPVTQITHETKHGILCTQMIAGQKERKRDLTQGGKNLNKDEI